jgi:hypothetical protein
MPAKPGYLPYLHVPVSNGENHQVLYKQQVTKDPNPNSYPKKGEGVGAFVFWPIFSLGSGQNGTRVWGPEHERSMRRGAEIIGNAG